MDTLYIPLYARIYVSKHFPSFFYDTKALSLESSIPNSMIQKQSNEYVCMASACRQYVLDHKIRHFLSSFPNGNVVFLGAGLETAYSRLSNTTASFYQVDLPAVIQIRQDLLGCGINRRRYVHSPVDAINTTRTTHFISFIRCASVFPRRQNRFFHTSIKNFLSKGRTDF